MVVPQLHKFAEIIMLCLKMDVIWRCKLDHNKITTNILKSVFKTVSCTKVAKRLEEKVPLSSSQGPHEP